MAFNLDKYKSEWKKFKEGVNEAKWHTGPDGVKVKSHDPFTNWFVEGSRSSPYIAGHLWMVSSVGFVVSTLGWLVCGLS